jgi:hypothetical protein
MQLLEDELLEISCSKVNCSNGGFSKMFCSKVPNYHTQDNAVIVITKATSVLHLINLKKKTVLHKNFNF